MQEYIKVKEGAEIDSESAVTFRESYSSHIDAFTDMKISKGLALKYRESPLKMHNTTTDWRDSWRDSKSTIHSPRGAVSQMTHASIESKLRGKIIH